MATSALIQTIDEEIERLTKASGAPCLREWLSCCGTSETPPSRRKGAEAYCRCTEASLGSPEESGGEVIWG